MRHKLKGNKLSRNTAHRNSLLKNLSSALILNESINTTFPKAKELKRYAEKIINSIPVDKPILFAPDQFLGKYLIKKTGRELVLLPGVCQVHVLFSLKELIQLKIRFPIA